MRAAINYMNVQSTEQSYLKALTAEHGCEFCVRTVAKVLDYCGVLSDPLAFGEEC